MIRNWTCMTRRAQIGADAAACSFVCLLLQLLHLWCAAGSGDLACVPIERDALRMQAAAQAALHSFACVAKARALCVSLLVCGLGFCVSVVYRAPR